jgi:hypothetical protein
MTILLAVRRWWVKRFRTTVRPALVNRMPEVVSLEDWEAAGGWEGAMVLGWEVKRPDWWGFGAWSAVRAESVDEARRRLDEWQDEMAARGKG